MFNLSGSEIVIILLLALVVLGPEKLPEAIRRFGRLYGELKRMSTGFQAEFRTAFEEPLKELKETAELTRRVVRDATAGEPESGGANATHDHIESQDSASETPFRSPSSESEFAGESDPE